jgi:hypothetical protein
MLSFIPVEKVYQYEHSSSYKVSDATREKLLDEIDEDEFFCTPLPGRLLLNRFDDFFREKSIDLCKEEDVALLISEFDCQCAQSRNIIQTLIDFAHLQPRLPDISEKETSISSSGIPLDPKMSREEIIALLDSLRTRNPTVDLAFYAFRDMSRVAWEPFLKAALERNPVSILGSASMTEHQLLSFLREMPDQSIYDGCRLAQPDEVWNFQRGDGWEKAICLANICRARHPGESFSLEGTSRQAVFHNTSGSIAFDTQKSFLKKIDF